MSGPEPRIYAYGVMRPGRGRAGPAPLQGVAGQPVRMISRGGLAALISDLSRQESYRVDEVFGDPDLVKDMILAHHRVLESMVDQYTVLPLRFGAVFESDDSVAAALEAHRKPLSEALERIEGAYEWGIKIFSDRAVLLSRLREGSPAIRAAREAIAATSEGRAFFLRRKLERISEEEIDRVVGGCIVDSLQLLLSTARAAATLKTQPRAVHGRADDMVWNGAYLVARNGEERFFACFAALRRIYSAFGFDYECSGPWPPSSFAECPMGASDEP